MTKTSLLIVEDLTDQAETIKTQLEGADSNLKIDIVNSSEEALEVFNKGELYDYVLTDLNLPGVSGLKFTQQILEKYSETRIILMSGLVSLSEEGKYYSIGIEKFLAKPFKPEDILAVFKHPKIYPLGDRRAEFTLVKNDEVTARYIGKKLPFPIYAVLDKKKKFVELCSTGEILEKKLITNLQFTGINKFYRNINDAGKEKKYLPVRVSTLMSGANINFDLFLEEKDNYIKKLDRGTSIEDNLINSFKGSGIKKLYLEEDDEPHYQTYLELSMDAIIDSADATNEDKVVAVKEMTHNKLKNALSGDKEPDQDTITELHAIKETFFKLLKKNKNAMAQFLAENSDPDRFTHCLNVANLACFLANQILIIRKLPESKKKTKVFDSMDMKDSEAKEILFMSGLVHEMGLVFISKERKTEIEELEQPDYKNYPIRGAEFLREAGDIHMKIPEVVSASEEYCDGSGFPSGLKKTQISIYSHIFNLAKAYDKQTLYEKKSPGQAMSWINENEGKFNKHLLPLLEAYVISRKI